jgi:predicted phage-related endonuclease
MISSPASNAFGRPGRSVAARHTIARPPNVEEWLDLRHRYWNASEAAVLADEHPFTTLADVSVRKLTRAIDEPNRAQARGQYLEAAIADWWADDHGVQLYEPDDLYVNGVVMATLDRRIVGSDTDAVEIKTTARRVTEPEGYWWWQCQAQCLAVGLQRVHLAVLDRSMDLATFVVEADVNAMTFIAEEATKVMAYIRRGEIPPDASLHYRHFERLHPRHDDSIAEFTDDLAADVAALARVRDQRRRLDSQENELKDRITAALGSAGVGMWEGKRIVIWRSSTRVGIDQARLLRDHPDLALEYRTETTYRSLRVMGPSS